MFEIGSGFLYRILKDALLFIRRNRRNLTESDRIELRAKWKAEIEAELHQRHAMGLGMDVYIRDVRRVDEYPRVDNEKSGMSSWYKVGLMDTYHRGIRAGLAWVDLVTGPDGGLVYADHKTGEEPEVTAILTGFIRYENIQHIDWHGDEYGSEPHVYCHFDEKGGTQYEALWFSERRESSRGWPYYIDLDTLDAVKKRSTKSGRSR